MKFAAKNDFDLD